MREGAVSETRVTEAAERIVQLKKDLGLLADPFIKGDNTVAAEEDRVAALESIRESITLLENDGTLPLGRVEGQRVLVTGPMADSVGLLVGVPALLAGEFIAELKAPLREIRRS